MSKSSPDHVRDTRFTRLYDAYYHRIFGYSQRRVGREDAADVVADTFAAAWRRLDDVPEGEQALYWLYATARRVLANHRRAERRRANLTSALENEVLLASSPPPSVDSRPAAAALARMPEDERELLLLVAWEGLDGAAVAAVLGCSRNAARIRLHRARRRFARELTAADDLKRRGQGGHVLAAGTPPGTLELEDSA